MGWVNPQMTKQDDGYRQIIEHYEACLERHGDSHLGVDWPNAADAETRYRVMLESIRPADLPATLLDFGCGAGHLLDFMRRNGRQGVEYCGLDASAKFIGLCRQKFQGTTFYHRDIFECGDPVEAADYVILNGVLTEKRGMSQDAMLNYMEALLAKVWPLAHKGMAFNVMSTQVQWQRDDLFHVPFDTMACIVAERLSRHFRFRQDYGLYEYTTCVYREAGR
jgi:SAM-dependent methyltransferase